MSDIQQNRIEQLEQDVEEYDEIHAYIAEIGEEKDIRSRHTEFDHDACLVTIDDGVTFYRLSIEHFVYWTQPREF